MRPPTITQATVDALLITWMGSGEVSYWRIELGRMASRFTNRSYNATLVKYIQKKLSGKPTSMYPRRPANRNGKVTTIRR